MECWSELPYHLDYMHWQLTSCSLLCFHGDFFTKPCRTWSTDFHVTHKASNGEDKVAYPHVIDSAGKAEPTPCILSALNALWNVNPDCNVFEWKTVNMSGFSEMSVRILCFQALHFPSQSRYLLRTTSYTITQYPFIIFPTLHSESAILLTCQQFQSPINTVLNTVCGPKLLSSSWGLSCGLRSLLHSKHTDEVMVKFFRWYKFLLTLLRTTLT